MEIYTDGGYSIPKGVGGWAVVVVKNNKVVNTFNGVKKQSTSNRMELFALGVALNYSKEVLEKNPDANIEILTDSKYACNGFNSWCDTWASKDWRKKDGRLVLNQDIWKRIYNYKSFSNIAVSWVKGHAGNKFNELADSLTRDY